MPKFYTKYEKAVEAARELNEENNELANLKPFEALTFIVTDGEQFAIADGRANLRAAERLGFDLAAAVKGNKVSRQYDEILNDLYMNTDERNFQTDD